MHPAWPWLTQATPRAQGCGGPRGRQPLTPPFFGMPRWAVLWARWRFHPHRGHVHIHPRGAGRDGQRQAYHQQHDFHAPDHRLPPMFPSTRTLGVSLGLSAARRQTITGAAWHGRSDPGCAGLSPPSRVPCASPGKMPQAGGSSGRGLPVREEHVRHLPALVMDLCQAPSDQAPPW